MATRCILCPKTLSAADEALTYQDKSICGDCRGYWAAALDLMIQQTIHEAERQQPNGGREAAIRDITALVANLTGE